MISELAVSLAHLENGEQDLKGIIDLSVEFFRVDNKYFRGLKKKLQKGERLRPSAPMHYYKEIIHKLPEKEKHAFK